MLPEQQGARLAVTRGRYRTLIRKPTVVRFGHRTYFMTFIERDDASVWLKRVASRIRGEMGLAHATLGDTHGCELPARE